MSQEKTLTSLIDKFIRKNLIYTRTMTIGKVLKIVENGWVEVDPQIQLVNADRENGTETNIDINRLVLVPIGYYKAGGFVITLPTSIGDEGILIFSDRSLDIWKSTSEKRPPDSARLHDVSDGVFIPFPTSTGGAIQNFDADNLVIGKEDGSAFISISKSDGSIQITSPVSFTVDAPVINLNGDTNVDGFVDATGELRGTNFVPDSGPTYNDHGHDQANDSDGDTEATTGTPVTGA